MQNVIFKYVIIKTLKIEIKYKFRNEFIHKFQIVWLIKPPDHVHLNIQ